MLDRAAARLVLLPMLAVSGPLTAQSMQQALIEDAVARAGDEVCAQLEPLPPDACKPLLAAAAGALAGSSLDLDALRDELRGQLTSPDFLSSAITRLFGEHVPLGLEFKQLDGENGESVLGLSFEIDYRLASSDVTSDGRWNRRYEAAITSTGTLTEEALENPRNFIEAKLSGFRWVSTAIPEQSEEFGARLTGLALEVAQCELDPDAEACVRASQEAFALLDGTREFLRTLRHYQYGVEAGIESDQDLDAKQTKLGAFVFAQHESWGGGSLLDLLNVTPAVRLGVESVHPNSETPRALLGDKSSFLRFSGELSLWMPLGARSPLALTFSYRHHRELDASDLVKGAGLDAFDLRTIGLTASNGLFVTYSSGRLPLDLQDDDVVELGWKTYF